MKRRSWLLAGAGLGAAAAGAGWQVWRSARDGSAASLWAMRFPRPGGGELVLSALRGRPLLLNFWATWCAPCIREMPALERFRKRYAAAGWNVVGLAVDTPEAVGAFLARVPIGFAIGIAGYEGAELARRLGNESGSLPFTVVFDTDGRIVARKLGESKEPDLEAWARESR